MMPTQWKIRKKENIMRFKVKDKVKIVDTGEVYSTYNSWVGKHVPNKYKSFWARGIAPTDTSGIYTIRACGNHEDYPSSMLYYIQNDNTKQCFIIDEEGIETISEFKIGDKVKIKKDVTLEEISNNDFNGCQISTMEFLLDASFDSFEKIYKVKEVVTVNCVELNDGFLANTIILDKVEEILDDKEKEYLKKVIEPFRNRIKWITKQCISRGEYIRIELEDDYTSLPMFEKGTMYKNMEVNKEYTLEELGLDE